MKVVLVGYGTRGDVQPMLCLAWELARRGHEPTLVAPINTKAWIERAGVRCVPLPVDVQALFAREEAQRMLANGKIATFFKWLTGVEREHLAGIRRALVEATEGAEAIVTHALMEDRAAAIGAARKIPVLPMYFFPCLPSSRFASPFIATKNLGPLNRFSHGLLIDMLWKNSRDDVQALRAELGVAKAKESFLRAVQRAGAPCALSYSAEVFPSPPDYARSNVVTGGIVPPDALKAALGVHGLPDDLSRFIDAGEPPVFLGFGSMPVLDVPRMLDLTRDVLRQVGRRGVIGAGWTDVRTLRAGDDTLCSVADADHAALLSRCAAAVHHGGSGTTYASLRAGCPTVVCSVFADQPFWGARVKSLGVGDTLPFAGLSAKALAAKLKRALDPEAANAARALGTKISAENGLERTVRLIEETLPRTPPPS